MSRRRGKVKSGTPTVAGLTNQAVAERGPREWVTWSISAGFLLLLAVYLLLFYRAEYAAGVPRYVPLGYLLVPDVLVRQWRAESLGQVWLVDRIGPFGLAAAIGAAAWATGQLVLRWLHIADMLDRVERFVMALGVGLSGWSVLTLLVGLAGWLHRPMIFVSLAALLCGASAWHRLGRRRQPAGHGSARGKRPEAVSQNASRRARRPWWKPRWWWPALPFVAVIFLGAVLPPIDFDVLEYHLQVPKEWVQQGRVEFLPHNVYGNMPLGAEMLATLAMALMPGKLGWWWGALAGKVLMAAFAPLTAWLLFAAGRRYWSTEAGIIACLLYLSTAWIAHVSVNGLNEGVVAFYLVGAYYAGRLWWDQRPVGPAGHGGLLALSGFLAGSATACKYTAVVFVVLPLIVVVIVGSRRTRWLGPAIFALAVTAGCGLWLGKNWVLSGNPTYPLMAGTLDGKTRTPEKNAQWQRAHQVPVDRAGHRYSLAQAGRSLRQVLGASSWHNPLLVPLAALTLVWPGRLRQTAYWWGAFLVIVAAWWLFTHRLDRFWVPALPLLALVAGNGATWSTEPVWRRLLWGIVGLGLLANFVLIASPLPGDNRYLVKLEQLRDDPRLTTVTLAHRYLNANVRAGQRALLVGDAAVFNLQVPVLYSTCFDTCIFEELLRGYSPADQAKRLAQRHITHLYVNWAEIRRYRRPGNYGFTDYVTPELVHDELEFKQRLIRRVDVPGLDPETGEIFEVLPGAD